MDSALEQLTLRAEDEHWWYRGRLRVVMDAVDRALRSSSSPRILDAGCGGGATLAALAARGHVVGLEPSAVSREKARGRGVGEVVDGTIEALPFEDSSFDLALVLDVIEHLRDDAGALRELRRVVVSGGALIVTVPAHPRLWSRHDELNHHFRRYTRATLAAAASASGWNVTRMSHFVTAALPAAVVARRFGPEGHGLYQPPNPVDRTLRSSIEAEAALIRRGRSLPAGLSLVAELRAG